MVNWYVLHTKPQKERQVAEHLRRKKIETYLPLVRITPVNPRAARERSLFPCYVFAKLDIQTIGFNTLQWTPGLRQVVQFGGQPAIVPDHFVVELKRQVGQIQVAGGLLFDGLQKGDQVKISRGPFAGYEAVFDMQLAGADRVRVLLELIQQQQRWRGPSRVIPLELNASSIEKVRPKR